MQTTGWIHRTTLRNKGVSLVPGVSYDKVLTRQTRALCESVYHTRKQMIENCRGSTQLTTFGLAFTFVDDGMDALDISGEPSSLAQSTSRSGWTISPRRQPNYIPQGAPACRKVG